VRAVSDRRRVPRRGALAHWRIGIRGQDFTRRTVRARLLEEANLEREADWPHRSPRRITIRADQAARYGVVQSVLAACSDPDVRLYRVSIAAAQAGAE
jgi:biopolymer transport protein ExbD